MRCRRTGERAGVGMFNTHQRPLIGGEHAFHCRDPTEARAREGHAGERHLGDLGRYLLREAETPLGRGLQHDAAVRCQAATVEGCGEFLASDAWQGEGQKGIFVNGGCGALRVLVTLGLDTQSVNAIRSVRDTRQQNPAMPVNKTG